MEINAPFPPRSKRARWLWRAVIAIAMLGIVGSMILGVTLWANGI